MNLYKQLKKAKIEKIRRKIKRKILDLIIEQPQKIIYPKNPCKIEMSIKSNMLQAINIFYKIRDIVRFDKDSLYEQINNK